MKASRSPRLLHSSGAGLLVVDVQERFRPAIQGFDQMVSGCLQLIRSFRIIGLPIWVTEQYPRGLGSTVSELESSLENVPVLEKTSFSSYGCPDLVTRMSEARVSQLLVCGIETHVCVSQTVHDLLAAGFRVHVATDAVASRKTSDREAALHKMEASGAILTTVEMAIFELLSDSRHPHFKEVQALFK